jgi:hypothetical protein
MRYELKRQRYVCNCYIFGHTQRAGERTKKFLLKEIY